MKKIFLAFCFTITSQSAFAALCPKREDHIPCTPVPGKATDRAKDKILELIADAKDMNDDLKILKAEFVRVRRNSGASDTDKLAACEAYRIKKVAQDLLYEDAMKRTEKLYHVGPDVKKLVIGKPADPRMDYIAGLEAKWGPQVTESGPGVNLAVKIKGFDNLYHFTGTTKMNPREEGGKLGVTVPDGRVFISREAFDIAHEKNNPGFLAALIYHESRHFKQLSRPPEKGSTVRRSLSSNEADEMRAYSDVIAHAADFGLVTEDPNDTDDADDMKAMLIKNAQAILDNKVTHPGLTPEEEAKWKNEYDRQLDLDKEYETLRVKVDEARRNQEAKHKADLEERERLAREAENVRQWREREKAYARAELEAEAGKCGYALRTVNRTDNTVIGFKGLDALHSFRRDIDFSLNLLDMKIIFLITRACDAVIHNFQQDTCNDSAPALRSRASSNEFNAQLDYMLGLYPDLDRFNNAGSEGECLENILANASKIADSKSLDKVVADYQKRRDKKQASDAKASRKERERAERERKERERQENPPPRDDKRPPSDPDHDEVWRRVNPIIKRP